MFVAFYKVIYTERLVAMIHVASAAADRHSFLLTRRCQVVLNRHCRHVEANVKRVNVV